MSPSRRLRIRFPFLLLTISLLVTTSGVAAAQASAAKTLDAWRQLKTIAEDALEAPRGPERIAKCEAFLKEHPDYPEPQDILSILARDYLETGDYDPARVAQIYEQLMTNRLKESDEYAFLAADLVERYYLKYSLPTESAERLLGWNREALERRRKAIEVTSDPATRRRDRQQIDLEAGHVSELEGRVLLAAGNVGGAVKKLEEAEATLKQSGGFIFLRDRQGKERGRLPAAIDLLDRLNLSLAAAYSRLGNKTAALDRLGRITGAEAVRGDFLPSLRRLRDDLKVPPPPVTEVRADPVPAPDFSLQDLDGKTVSLSEYRGKVVLLMTWATW